MNTYVAFYGEKRVEVESDTTWHAAVAVAQLLRVPDRKRHLITVVLAAKNGAPVIHSTAEFG